MDRSQLPTEQRLKDAARLDEMSPREIVELMHAQDQVATVAVGKVITEVAKGIELIVLALRAGGRLIYVGAGTSGRLGVLDASECPPTFRTEPAMVQGVIAGGKEAMFVAKEGAEDRAELGAEEMASLSVAGNDVIVGIASGGTTPFVHGALRKARSLGAKTIFLACVGKTKDEAEVDVEIRPITGPEVVTGSTRLKAGTATKMVLNMLSTGAMVRLGKTYGNLMVDLKASNSKLKDRATRIVSEVVGVDKEWAGQLLEKSEGHAKVAIVMGKKGCSREDAVSLLEKAQGNLRKVIGALDIGH